MGKINLLDDLTIDKIAAGEVVERPASVVKELVENSIDAGALSIDITVSGGGLESIRVVDDGCGMAPDDVSISLQRHATSKIREAADLSTVPTMGFRGEALPSIAAVSRLRLCTRRECDLAGTLIEVHGGRFVRQVEHGCVQGTEIRVDNLFYNTPARLKFIKSEGAETARITDTVQRLALAWPSVAFSLEVNGKKKLITAGDNRLSDVLHQVYGSANGRLFLPLEWQGPLLKVRGYISRPSLARATRNMQSFYVNGRYIRSPLLSDALQTAYQTLLPRNRFPAAVLFVDIDTHEVDVNVHPSKKEVRFSRERDVYRQVLSAVRQALHASSLVPELGCGRAAGSNSFYPKQNIFNPGNANTIPVGQQDDRWGHNIEPAELSLRETAAGCSVAEQSDIVSFPSLQPLGQYRGSYILAQSEDLDLYLVDQHAAHERILYELFSQDVENGTLPVQTILPLTVELDPPTAAALRDKLKIFEELGLNFEVFGNNTFILRTVPLFFRNLPSQAEIMGLVALAGQEKEHLSLFEETLKLLACKSAIKANDSMTREEMSALLVNLKSAQSPYTCPHGRPTTLLFRAIAVDTHFRRR